MTVVPADTQHGTPRDGQDESLRRWLAAQATQHSLTYLLAHVEDGVIWGSFRDGPLVTADEQIAARPDLQPWALPQLRVDRLQQCRAFGDSAEVLLWRGGSPSDWTVRLVRESEGQITVATVRVSGSADGWPDPSTMWDEATAGQPASLEQLTPDEAQILWGTRAEQSVGGFTLLTDGRQGLRHAVPLSLPADMFAAPRQRPHRPVRLIVRHYLAYDREDERGSDGQVMFLATGAARIALSRLVTLSADPPATAGLEADDATQHSALEEE